MKRNKLKNNWIKYWGDDFNLNDVINKIEGSENLKFTLKYTKKVKGRILEAGCGTGAYVFYLNEKGKDVYGLDYFKDIIERNKKNALKIGLENKFIVGDVRKLNFPDNYFEVYLSFGVIEHFKKEERQKILKEAYRVLKKGGLIICSTPGNFFPSYIRTFILSKFYNNVMNEYFLPFNFFKKEISLIGFKEILSEKYDTQSSFRDGFYLYKKRFFNVIPNIFFYLKKYIYNFSDHCEKKGINFFKAYQIFIGQKV